MKQSIFGIAAFLFSGSLQAIQTYEGQSACEKETQLWDENIRPTQYKTLPDSLLSLEATLNALRSLKTAGRLKDTFDTSSDFMPKGRAKTIHSFGVVAPVEFKAVENSRILGILAKNIPCGLLRLSYAGPATLLGVTPGIAWKALRDGGPSINVMALYSLNGQGKDRNFFRHALTSHIPPVEVRFLHPTTWFLAGLGALFSTVKAEPNHLDLRSWSADSDLWALEFAPREILTKWYEDYADLDFRTVLAALPAGTRIYDVHKLSEKGERTFLGSLYLKANPLASSFGDDRLFFKHPK